MGDVPQLQPLLSATEQQQAGLFYARERRRSLAGLPRLSRTHRYPIPTATIPAAAWVADVRNAPVTFQTAIRITSGVSATGLVFEIGNATTAIALYLDTTVGGSITLRAGGAAVGSFAEAVFEDLLSPFPDTIEFDIVASVRPGDGRARLWINGNEAARDTASGGALSAGWAAASDGAFAAAATGALPGDVTQTGAPTGFEVIEPLSGYARQFPRHFV